MASFNTGCFVITFLCVALVTVAGSYSTDLFDDTFYGIEDLNGDTSIIVSGPSSTEPPSQDGLATQPTDPDRDRFPGRKDGPPPSRRGHSSRHHRGYHGHGHRGRHHGDEAPEGPHHHGPHHYENMWFMRANLMANWTEEQRLNHICERIQSHNSGRGRHRGGMMASKLRNMNEQERQRIVDLWNTRKQDMTRCCGMSSIDEKQQCVNEIRTARYDRVCRGEEPLCPWAAYRSQTDRPWHGRGHHFAENMPSASNTTDVCCAREGSERLQCFDDAKKSYQQRLMESLSSRTSPSTYPSKERRRERPGERSDERSPRRGFGRERLP